MKVLSLIVLISVLLISCQKEEHYQEKQNVPPAQNDSIFLSEYIELDTTLAPGSDTTYKDLYTYDGKHRLSQYYSTDFSEQQTIQYYYSGNDTLPFKEVSIWTNYGQVFRDTIFHSYLKGLVSEDSTIEYDNTTNQFWVIETHLFTPNSDGIFLQHRYYSSPIPSLPYDEGSLTIFKTYQNGNIVSQDDTSAVVLFSYVAHEKVSYDSKINPFYRAKPVRYPMLYFWFNQQKNNPLDDITWDQPSQQVHLTYSYTYRQDGYPLTVKVNDVGYTDGWKGLYFYTK